MGGWICVGGSSISVLLQCVEVNNALIITLHKTFCFEMSSQGSFAG